MRVISGSCKGKKLFSVPGWDTRPTSDRIKESIFNILNRIEPDTVVLDLFAGTGALAIEALSRGATNAVLIDNVDPALKAITQNLSACGLSSRAKVVDWDILLNLNCLIRFQSVFNLVFMDPPYNKHIITTTLDKLVDSNSLAQHAEIIIEHSIKEPLTHLPLQLAAHDERRYGKTLVSFLTYTG